jgi:signal transduction histidine kinase
MVDAAAAREGPFARSLALRLALLLLAIVAVAITCVYLYVVPPLVDELRAEELRSLSATASRYAPAVERAVEQGVDARVAQAVRRAADRAGARATLLAIDRTPSGLRATPRADSANAAQLSELRFAPALAAAASGRVAVGAEPSSDGRMGEAAVPLGSRSEDRRRIGYAIVFSRSLDDVERNVALVRRRFLLAGGIAIVLALGAGLGVAMLLRRRIERLRRAARAVAAGDFSVRFAVDSEDEIGQLAIELDDMRRQLAELDEARSRFIATASHELRTPIFSLGGFLELLADEDVDDETRAQFFAQLRAQVDRLQKLATDLLDLSRLEAGALELRPEPVDVAALARSVLAEFEPAIAAHRSALRLRLPDEPIEAVCDPERVAQILRILVDNALTHTPEGTRMDVSAARAGGVLRLAVRDAGGGIAGAALPHVFDPFYTSDDAQGSGLGLAIASELADRMRGTLDAASADGSTTFTLEVPTAVEERT